MNETDFKERLNRDAARLKASLPPSRHAQMMEAIGRTEMNADVSAPAADLRTVQLRGGGAWVRMAAVAAGCALLAVVILARFQPAGEPEIAPPETIAEQKTPETAADESLIRPAAVVSFMSYPVRIHPAAAKEAEPASEEDEERVELAKLVPCQQTVAVLVDIFRPAAGEY